MHQSAVSRVLKKTMILVFFAAQLVTAYAQAAMVPTSAVIESQGQTYTQAQLQTALASEELRTQLQDMGVDTAQLNDRIASLTPAEIQHLNAELESQAAGGDILGILLTIFIIFVITDMLCATNIFSFVKCINK